MSSATEYQGWNAWYTKFKPIKNHLDEYPSYMFETYGEDYEFVKSQDPKYVWTLVDGDMMSLLLAGVHYVNRLGYYVCEFPWDNELDSVLLTVEVECECYSEEGYEDGEHGDPDCGKCEGYGYVTQDVKDK